MNSAKPDVKSLFGRALEFSSLAERAAYLGNACNGNVSLQAELNGLLQAHEQAGSFLKKPGAPGITSNESTDPEISGTRIGPYKLLQQIGEGGMGLVYMAEQQEPVRRKVALKIIKPGLDSKQVIARFEVERQALAIMDHQNIAKVFEAGTTEKGQPYFVMELVHGVPLTKYCDDHQLTPRQRLELFLPVCQAVQHAHQKGIIHRDLKPSNILVTMYDDKPVPKVIDFGVAKAVEQRLTEKTLFTQYGTMVGTYEYMSPEQAEMNAFGVDTRSDIYSLGVLLYELLTGTTPLERQLLNEAAFGEIVRLIKEEEPPKPSTRLSTSGAALAGISHQRGSAPEQLTQQVRGELDWIVMRCLEKDRTRRYETANNLARDLQNYLTDEPVEACPPTAGYKLRKFVRKHRRLLATAAAFAALLLLGAVASAWQAVRATQAEIVADANAVQSQEKEQEAKQQRSEAQALAKKLQAAQAQLQRTLYAAQMNLAQHAWDAGGVERVRELLDQHRPKPGESDLRGFEWHFLDRQCEVKPLLTLEGGRFMAYSPDGKRLASSFHKMVKVWDTQTGQELLALKGHTGQINYVASSRDGKLLASASSDKTARLWDAQTGKELFNCGGHTSWVNSVAFSPDGQLLASASSDKTVKVWDAQTGKELLTVKGHKGDVLTVAFSPDGKRLVSGGRTWDGSKSASIDGEVKVWDAQTGKELLSLKGHDNGVESVAFSPDGTQLVSGTAGPGVFGEGPGELKLWNARTGQELFSLKGLSGMVTSVAFSSDGKRLASGVADSVLSGGPGHVHVWDAQTGQQLFTINDNFGVFTVAFSPDGKHLASSGAGTKVWDAQGGNPLVINTGADPVACVAFSPDGKRLASGSAGLNPLNGPGEVKVWDARTGQELFTLKGHTTWVTGVAFSPDGKRLASAGASWTGRAGEMKVWDTQTGKELFSLPYKHLVPDPGGTIDTNVAYSPDGKLLASTGGGVNVWNAQTGKELRHLSGQLFGIVSFSPDGKHLVSANFMDVGAFTGGRDAMPKIERGITVWDVQTGKVVLTFKNGAGRLAFSPDGKHLVTTSQDKTVKVWDAQTGQELLSLKGHTGPVYAVAFSSNGKRLATTSQDKTVKVWDAQTGQELMSVEGHVSYWNGVAFSPDSHRLASGSAGGTVKIWDATPLPQKP